MVTGPRGGPRYTTIITCARIGTYVYIIHQLGISTAANVDTEYNIIEQYYARSKRIQHEQHL